MDWNRYGPDGLLIRFASEVGDEAFQWGQAILDDLQKHPPPGLTQWVPAFTTVLLEFDLQVISDPRTLAPGLIRRWKKLQGKTPPPRPIKEIPVEYNGPDLASLAQAKGLSVEEVCRRHAAPVYKVYMIGFAPGFPYLGDLDPSLHTPRLASPRKSVPAGSVAIGGEHTGIYPMQGPGGWNLIGRTKVNLVDPERADPSAEFCPESIFYLQPGDRVRFVPVDTST